MIDFFFDAYLNYQRETENPLPFLQWVDEIYDYEALSAQFHSNWWGNLITDKLLHRE
jgi:hypothetical protein